MASTMIDPAFNDIKSKPAGMYLWRIENLTPVPVDQEGYGKFFSGDSYILLVAEARGKSSTLNYSIHFWLGESTTHDEMGAAAYKTVELDNALGGAASQFRETQGHESSKFQSYFKSLGGLMYMEGGAESGFKHVEGKVYPTRLLQLKGKRNVRVKQVEASTSSLNDGDVFILDMGLNIYQWNGAEANKMEKAKALTVCTRLRDDRGALPEVRVLDSSEKDDERTTEFWVNIGGYAPPKSAEDGGDDKAEEKLAKKELKLYKCDDSSGSMKTTIVAEGKLARSLLENDATFVLDTGTALYCWIGKHADKSEKKEAFTVANAHLIENKRPAWTPVSMVLDEGETPDFKSFFFQWEPPMKPRDWSTPVSSGVAKSVEQKEIDVDALVTSTRARAGSTMADDGSGKVEVWRIENFDKVKVDDAQVGNFFSGDSYIVLYTYTPNGKSREEYIIYFWQGKKSTPDEKGASALLATKMDDDMGGRPVQVRVVQGKEPSHFCALFKGKLVTHDGGKASGFSTSKQKDEADDDGISLFHIRGTNMNNTRAAQVPEVCGSLNSGDCFVLSTEATVYCWSGKGASETERATSKTTAESLMAWNTSTTRELVEVAEGEEDETFWSSLGGKGEYSSEAALVDAPQEPRLFEISNISGSVKVEEVHNFAQEDLLDDDVMMLDTYSTVFIWIGSSANATEKKFGMDIAQKYIASASAQDGRHADTSIVTCKAGSEPPMFTCHFLGWDAESAQIFEDPYEKKMKSLSSTMSFSSKPSWAKKEETKVDVPETVKEEEVASAPETKEAAAPPVPVAKPEAAAAAPAAGTFTYAQLKGTDCEVRGQIDPKKKEEYLSDTEFSELFGMNKEAFSALPAWKRKKAKVTKELF